MTAVPLFIPGPIGWLGGAGLNALNTASPGDDWQTQTADAALGAGKWFALKGVFSLSARLPGGFLTRASLMAPAQRGIETGLNRRTYFDEGMGQVNIARGLKTAAYSVFNPYSLGADAGSQLLSAGTMVAINYVTGGALGRYPLLGTMAIGSMYGFNSSVSNDVREHLEHGTELTLSSVAEHGLTRAGIAALAAFPGGLMEAHNASLRAGFWQSPPRPLDRDGLPKYGIGIVPPPEYAISSDGVLEVTNPGTAGHAFSYVRDRNGQVTDVLSLGPTLQAGERATDLGVGALEAGVPARTNVPIKREAVVFERTLAPDQFALAQRLFAEKGSRRASTDLMPIALPLLLK